MSIGLLTRPEVHRSEKDFAFKGGQRKVFLNQTTAFCTDTDIIADITTVQGRAGCPQEIPFGQSNGDGAMVAVVFSLMVADLFVARHFQEL